MTTEPRLYNWKLVKPGIYSVVARHLTNLALGITYKVGSVEEKNALLNQPSQILLIERPNGERSRVKVVPEQNNYDEIDKEVYNDWKKYVEIISAEQQGGTVKKYTRRRKTKKSKKSKGRTASRGKA